MARIALKNQERLRKLKSERKAEAAKTTAEARQETPKIEAEPDPTPQTDAGLNYTDPWDMDGAVQQPAAAEGDDFSRFRGVKPVALEMPDSVQSISQEDEEVLSDFAMVATHERWSKGLAQSLVTLAADALRVESPSPHGYDPKQTVTELRFEWGADTEAILGQIEQFCAKRPALATYLDNTGLGDSPAILRMLAAVAQDESLMTKAGAKTFIEALGQNSKYWQGDKLDLAKAKLAFTMLG